MYEILVTLHSVVRWVAVIASVAALLYALYAVATKADWSALGDQLGALFIWGLRLNLFIGLALWILRFNEVGFNVFFNAIHPLIILVALGIAEMLTVRRRRTDSAAGKWRLLLIGTLLPLVLIISAIPAYARLTL